MRHSNKPVVAWQVEWSNCPGIVSIVACISATRARSATMRQIKEAGYQPSYFEMQVRRAKSYDQWAAAQIGERIGKPVSELIVRDELRTLLDKPGDEAVKSVV